MISLLVPERKSSSWVWENGWTRGGTVVQWNPTTLAGVQVNEETALNVSAIWACTRALAQPMGMLPAILYRDLGDGRRERATDDPLYSVLRDTPNREMDSMTCWEMMGAWSVNCGNAYAEKEIDGRGNTLALWPIHPSRVSPQRNDAREIEYRVRTNGLEDVLIPGDRMLNVVGPLSQNGITANGVIRQALQSIGKAAALDQYTASFWGNGARPGGLLKLDGDLTPDERDALRRDWIEMHGGPGKANKPAVLPAGISWQEFGVSNEQAQLLEVLQFSVEDLARWYGVPPHVIGHLLRATWSNVEFMQIDYRMFAIQPLAVRFERAIKRQIIGTDNPLYVEWLLDALERADTKTRAEALAAKVNSAQMTPNEARKIENMPPDPNGDSLLLQMNMTTLDRIVSGESLTTKQQNTPTRAADTQDAGKVAQSWLDSVWRYMIRREVTQAVDRSSDAKRFMAWLDTYDDHRVRLSEAIRDPLAAWLASRQDSREATATAGQLAADHVNASRELLLTACECTPEELQRSVSSCVSTWEATRPWKL